MIVLANIVHSIVAIPAAESVRFASSVLATSVPALLRVIALQRRRSTKTPPAEGAEGGGAEGADGRTKIHRRNTLLRGARVVVRIGLDVSVGG